MKFPMILRRFVLTVLCLFGLFFHVSAQTNSGGQMYDPTAIVKTVKDGKKMSGFYVQMNPANKTVRFYSDKKCLQLVGEYNLGEQYWISWQEMFLNPATVDIKSFYKKIDLKRTILCRTKDGTLIGVVSMGAASKTSGMKSDSGSQGSLHVRDDITAQAKEVASNVTSTYRNDESKTKISGTSQESLSANTIFSSTGVASGKKPSSGNNSASNAGTASSPVVSSSNTSTNSPAASNASNANTASNANCTGSECEEVAPAVAVSATATEPAAESAQSNSFLATRPYVPFTASGNVRKVNFAKPSDSNGFQFEPKILPVARPDYSAIDNYVKNLTIPKDSTVEAAVKKIIAKSKTDKEKARAIFTWIACNIDYETDRNSTNEAASYYAGGTFKNRRGICNGYSQLFKLMGEIAGLTVDDISGYSKNYEYIIGDSVGTHSWNLVHSSDGDFLLDCTWAAGYVLSSNKFVREFKPYWFDVDPAYMIFSHFPATVKFQKLSETLTKEQFLQLPYVRPNFESLGIDGAELLEFIYSHTRSWIPNLYDYIDDLHNGDVITKSIPMTDSIAVNVSAKFDIATRKGSLRLNNKAGNYTADGTALDFSKNGTKNGNLLKLLADSGNALLSWNLVSKQNGAGSKRTDISKFAENTESATNKPASSESSGEIFVYDPDAVVTTDFVVSIGGFNFLIYGNNIAQVRRVNSATDIGYYDLKNQCWKTAPSKEVDVSKVPFRKLYKKIALSDETLNRPSPSAQARKLTVKEAGYTYAQAVITQAYTDSGLPYDDNAQLDESKAGTRIGSLTAVISRGDDWIYFFNDSRELAGSYNREFQYWARYNDVIKNTNIDISMFFEKLDKSKTVLNRDSAGNKVISDTAKKADITYLKLKRTAATEPDMTVSMTALENYPDGIKVFYYDDTCKLILPLTGQYARVPFGEWIAEFSNGTSRQINFYAKDSAVPSAIYDVEYQQWEFRSGHFATRNYVYERFEKTAPFNERRDCIKNFFEKIDSSIDIGRDATCNPFTDDTILSVPLSKKKSIIAQIKSYDWKKDKEFVEFVNWMREKRFDEETVQFYISRARNPLQRGSIVTSVTAESRMQWYDFGGVDARSYTDENGKTLTAGGMELFFQYKKYKTCYQKAEKIPVVFVRFTDSKGSVPDFTLPRSMDTYKDFLKKPLEPLAPGKISFHSVTIPIDYSTVPTILPKADKSGKKYPFGFYQWRDRLTVGGTSVEKNLILPAMEKSDPAVAKYMSAYHGPDQIVRFIVYQFDSKELQDLFGDKLLSKALDIKEFYLDQRPFLYHSSLFADPYVLYRPHCIGYSDQESLERTLCPLCLYALGY